MRKHEARQKLHLGGGAPLFPLPGQQGFADTVVQSFQSILLFISSMPFPFMCKSGSPSEPMKVQFTIEFPEKFWELFVYKVVGATKV